MLINLFRNIVYIVIFISLLSCTSDKPAGSLTPEGEKTKKTQRNYSIEITPFEADKNTILNLAIYGYNLTEAKVDVIEWFVNETADASSSQYQFNPVNAKRGDNISAKVVINGSPLFSNIVTIKNALPIITGVDIRPDIVNGTPTLAVQASFSDADEDAVSLKYKWTVNGEYAGEDKKVNAVLKRGDKISVQITPFDGESYGKTVVIDREIYNMPPMIAENKEYEYNGRIFKHQVKASDPDNDKLTYEIKDSPEGMTINPDTGLILWTVPSGFSGDVSTTVIVKDGNGGVVSNNLFFRIKLTR
ncbi:MAG: putative Ig domain-containing protein [Nitrospiraceae bacterium]|nr:putative Ig domain-containing protein [Nitrospiraceae bacterium]